MIRRLASLAFEVRAAIVILVLAGLPLLVAIHQPMARSAEQIPLIAATLRGDVETVARLIAAGANVDEFDHDRNTALIFAARDGRTEIAGLLLAAGADASWIDAERVTPLILASHKNHIDIARLLLQHGADRDIRDKWGRQAIDYARRRGEGDAIFRLLIGLE